eukprot:Clim_evm17s191 gene=Clim_evmTU17s191
MATRKSSRAGALKSVENRMEVSNPSTPTGKSGLTQALSESANNTPGSGSRLVAARKVHQRNPTPLQSPKRRKSGAVPESTLEAANRLGNNNDEAERAALRKKRLEEIRARAAEDEAAVNVKAGENGTPLKGISGANANRVADVYANCIRLVSENRVNRRNAWDMQLIDYINEVVGKENAGRGSGIDVDFQAASTTIDASVKIFSYRVDSVHDDTFKVVKGLNRNNENENEDNDDEEGEEEVGEDGQQKKKRARKYAHSAETLETKLENITNSSLDQTLHIDPLFAKMSAAFDGDLGAQGLLMNQLGSRKGVEMLFDSQDSFVDKMVVKNEVSEIDHSQVDLSAIMGKIKDHIQNIRETTICGPFRNFRFNGDGMDDDDDKWAVQMQRAAIREHASETDVYGDTANDFGGYIGENMYDDSGDAFNVADPIARQEEILMQQDMAMARRMAADGGQGTSGNQITSVPMLVVPGGEKTHTDYSYFDPILLRTWIGPEHWSFGTSNRLRQLGTAAGSGKSSGTTKAKREPLFLRFSHASFTPEDMAAIDGQLTRGKKNSNLLSQTTLDKWDVTSTVLPEDLGYGIEKLTTMFTRPWRTVALPGTGAKEAQKQAVEEGIFIMQPMQDRNQEADDGLDWNNGDYGMVDDAPMDAEEAWDMDHNGPDGYGGDTDGVVNAGDLLAATAEQKFATGNIGDELIDLPERVAKMQISYARKAKIVDVRKVKTALWHRLVTDEAVDFAKAEAEEDAAAGEGGDASNFEDPRRVPEERDFRKTFHKLRSDLPSDQSQNLSVPIAFVCLLHLCNEKNLALEGAEDLSGFTITQGSSAA